MENKEVIGIIEDLEKALEDNGIIAQAPEIKEALKLSVEALKREGEWIDTGSGQECNVCHEIQYGYDNFRHFCANCGARMTNG